MACHNIKKYNISALHPYFSLRLYLEEHDFKFSDAKSRPSKFIGTRYFSGRRINGLALFILLPDK